MFADGVIEASSTTGSTDPYVLTGAVFGALTFAQGFPAGGTVAYFAQTEDKTKWEFGIGMLTIGPPRTITRATIRKSSNAGSAVNWLDTDVYYVFSIASADAVAGLIAGGMADNVRPWWVRQGGRWWNYVAGIGVGWIDTLYSGAADIRTGFFDAVKALYFPDNRRPSTAVGAASKVFAAADIGGSFTFNTAAAPRTATLPASATAKDGYHLELKGTSPANGIVLTPDAGDGIEGGGDGVTKTIPGGRWFTIRWDAAADTWVTDYVPSPYGHIGGLTYANNASDATNDIDIAAGGCADDVGGDTITVAALTKRLDAAWAAGTNQGGLDTGSVADSPYFIHAIKNPTTGATDILFSLSRTAPTMPAGYTLKRVIGWFRRVSSANLPFHTYELSGGGIHMAWDSPTVDVNGASIGTSRSLQAIKVPSGISVMATLAVTLSFSGGNARHVNISCPDQTDAAVNATTAVQGTTGFVQTVSLTAGTQSVSDNTGTIAWQQRVRTNTSGEVAMRAPGASATVYASTIGFEWSRR